MSWIKENYHTVALGGGALVLVGLGYLGYSANQAENEAFNANSPPKKQDTTAKGYEIATGLTASITKSDPIVQQKTKAGRPVELFTSVNLYTKDGRTNDLLDLLLMEGPVHSPIPNQWWVDHRIDPSYSDSPQRDQDEDGFTNMEEFISKTDPNDAKSIGDLVEKLEVVTVESDIWLLLFKSVLGEGYQFDFQFKPFEGRVQTNRIPASEAIAKGDTFFSEDPGKARFKLKSVEAREEDGPTGRRPRNWAIIEDLSEGKKGKTYELMFNLPAAQRSLATQYDHTVTFRLNAIGEEGNQFKVKESGSFSIPAGGEGKDYKLIEVKLEDPGPNVRKAVAIVVQYEVDGETKTREISVSQ